MKFNLKKKIILYLILTHLIIAVSLSAALYKYAGAFYYTAFLDSKLSLARSIALSIDGDKHKTFTSLEATKDREYQKYLHYLNTIRLQEEYMTYLFTINYEREKDKVTYIVDSDIMKTDTIWITTEFFGFALSIGEDNKINIKYNENFYSEDFDVPIGKTTLRLQLDKNGTLYLGDKELVKITSKRPLILEACEKQLSIDSRELYSQITINNKPVEVYCSFTAKGESQSMPGEYYMESEAVVEEAKQVIRNGKDKIIRRNTQTSIYGDNPSTVYGIIKDSQGEANGLVVIELFDKEISNFERSVLWIFLLVSLITFIITITLTSLFSEYLIIPIKELAKAAKQVGSGNLEYKIQIKRTDELGMVGKTFNQMVDNLKKACLDNKKANEELSGLKNNLERLVEERTLQLNKTNSKLGTALSEVNNLKGLLPICSSCNNIRDDKGNWNQIENYIRAHSQADFTHSICPDCSLKLYPEMHKQKNKPL